MMIATFNGLSVVHDDDGNMTSGPLNQNTLVSFHYDARNRLVAIGDVSYQYGPDGHRISRTDTDGTTEYTVDPNTGLSKVLVRTKPDNSKTYYVYGMGLLYEVNEAEETLTYHYDYRGSTRKITADDGHTVTDSVEYTPYGTITHRTGGTDTPFLYNGMFGVMTDGNGLIYMRARYFNPFIMRFVNADPIGFAGGMNWFAYASGNPISRIDPQGTYDGGSTVTGAAMSQSPISGMYAQSELDFFNANGWMQTGASVTIQDNYSQHIPTVASLAIGGPALIKTGVTGVKYLASGGRNIMNILTNTPARTTVIRTGTMQFDDAVIATGNLARTSVASTSSASLSTSQSLGAQIFSNYTRFAVTTGSAGLGLGLATDLQPNDANLSLNPFTLPFEIGNLAGGLISAEFPNFEDSH